MNGMVDSRVVEMHFDNSDFMEKINETIEALERLNEQISSINQSQGLNKLGENMSNNDLSNVATAVDGISNRFSTLGIVGMTIIQRLTNAGIDMALKIGNGFRAMMNQIKEGGSRRALNLEQAQFRLEGVLGSAEKVKQVMEDVDWAVTGTAYGLDEAAVSASMFAATGIEAGETMKTTLRSIAGIAATFGTDFQTISNIMVDASAAGHLTNDALTRLTMQGVPAMQLLQKEFGKTSEEIQKMATDGKISFEEFAKLMDDAYGTHAQDANKTFTGSLANMKTALSRLGEAFTTPAMQAAIPVLNGMREAISSFTSELKIDLPANNGLVTVFTNAVSALGTELFILFRLLNGGTFSEDEIKSFSKYASGDLIKMAETARSTHSVFKDFAVSVGNIGKMIIWAFQRIRDAFLTVFPNATIENFKAVMMTFNAAVSNFAIAHGPLDGVYNVFVGIFSLFKASFNIVSGVLRVFVAFGKAVTGFLGHTVSLSEGFANIGKGLAKLTGATDIFDFFVSVIDGAGKVVGKVFETIFESFSKFIGSVGKTVSGIDNVNDALTMMGIIWAGLFGARRFELAKNKISGIGKIFKDFSDALRAINFTPGKINTMIDQVTTSLSTMTAEVQSKAVRNIALAILALAIGLKILADLDNEGLARGLAGVTVLLIEMAAVMKILTGMAAGDASKSMKGLYAMGSVTNALIKIGASMILMAIALKMIAELDPNQLAAGLIGMTIMLAAVLGFVIALDKLQTNVADAKVGTMMIGVALALTLIAKAVQTMGSLKPTELAKGLASVIVVMAAIFGFMAAMNKMGGASKGMVLAGIGMIAIATAVNILAPALQKLGSMSLEQMAKGLSAMAIAMVTMAAVSQSMSAGGAVGMLVMSVALSSLGSTIERIGSLDIITIAKGLGTIIVAIAALGAAAVLLAPASAALLALGGAMILVSASFAIFGAGLIMIGAGLTSISAGIMSFTSVTSTAVGMFINTVKMMLQELIMLIPSVAASLAEGFVVFIEQIASLAPRFTEAATTIITSLIEALENNIPRLVKTGLRLIVNFLEGLEEAIPRISNSCAEIIAGFIDGIAQGLPDIIQSGIDLTIAFINGLAEGIRNNTEAVNAAIRNLCSAILESFMSFFGISSPSTVMEQQGTFLMQGLLNGIKSVGGIPAALLGAVKNAFGRLGGYISKFKQKGFEIIKNIGAGIRGKASDIKNKVGDAINKAKAKVGEYAGKFKDAGKNLISGVAKGIRNGASSLLSAAGSMAQKALDKFKQKLGISSPSKVFAAEARWIPEGVAVGINKTANKVQKAVESMAVSAIDPLSQAISRAYSYLEADSDFSPTITPILDLSEVRRDAGGIGSIFGTETVSLASSIGQNDIQNIQNNNLMNQLLTKMDKIMNSDKQNSANITNHFTVNGNDNPEQFVNSFIRTLDREMKMRAV